MPTATSAHKPVDQGDDEEMIHGQSVVEVSGDIQLHYKSIIIMCYFHMASKVGSLFSAPAFILSLLSPFAASRYSDECMTQSINMYICTYCKY